MATLAYIHGSASPTAEFVYHLRSTNRAGTRIGVYELAQLLRSKGFGLQAVDLVESYLGLSNLITRDEHACEEGALQATNLLISVAKHYQGQGLLAQAGELYRLSLKFLEKVSNPQGLDFFAKAALLEFLNRPGDGTECDANRVLRTLMCLDTKSCSRRALYVRPLGCAG